jgi:RNA polymerase sigma-70 factor (ECF subfamily)
MPDATEKGAIEAIGADVKTSWHSFLDLFEPVRPELYRYCRHLTRSPWDAEDLAQDAMARAFVTLGTMFGTIKNPRAWLFRIASNLWIDRTRHARYERAIEGPVEVKEPAEPRATREAAATLIGSLSPQERAAVVLKDIFDFSLEEIADAVSSTPGAVKAALHRGRGRLAAPEQAAPRVVASGILDAFCEAFNARDLDRLTALVLDSATVEIVGVVTEYGPDAPKDPRTGSFAGSMGSLTFDERGGVAPEYLEGYLGGGARCAVHPYRDSSVLLFWFEHEDGPKVRTVMTVDTDGDRIVRVRNYFFTPDVITEICSELGLPYSVNGYRYWLR